jgi:competence protein ComEC
MLPPVAPWSYGLFITGMLWLALWTGRVRLWGIFPSAIAITVMILAPTPDILLTGDGHHVGITGEGSNLLVLRAGRGDYMRDNLLEMAGMEGDLQTLDDWPGARCSADFCSLVINRNGKRFSLLMSRSREYIDDMALSSACERADIVIADRRLPWSCQPKMLKADRTLLATTGGITINLHTGKIRTVAETQGRHGWYRLPTDHMPAARVASTARKSTPE